MATLAHRASLSGGTLWEDQHQPQLSRDAQGSHLLFLNLRTGLAAEAEGPRHAHTLALTWLCKSPLLVRTQEGEAQRCHALVLFPGCRREIGRWGRPRLPRERLGPTLLPPVAVAGQCLTSCPLGVNVPGHGATRVTALPHALSRRAPPLRAESIRTAGPALTGPGPGAGGCGHHSEAVGTAGPTRSGPSCPWALGRAFVPLTWLTVTVPDPPLCPPSGCLHGARVRCSPASPDVSVSTSRTDPSASWGAGT